MAVEPFDEDARQAAASERALLGALLLDSAKAWPQVKDIVTIAHIARADHRLIFGAIAGLMDEAGVADPALLVDRLGDQLDAAGGVDYIAGLYEESMSAGNAAAYAKTVRQFAGRGEIVNLADRIKARGRLGEPGDAIDDATAELARIRRDTGDTTPLWPAPLDLASLLATEPTKPRMIVPDWLPAGYATMLAGHGGAGKSSVALHFAAAVALGRSWWGLGADRRRVLYLSCEDRADVVHWRLNRLCAREGWDAADLSWLLIRDLVGYEAILYRPSGDGLVPTRAYRELARIMAEDPTALLVVDGVADTYGGNENDRGQVKTFVNALVRLVNAEGAVLLVHHVNKQSASTAAQQEGYSGSTGWHNSVRARWYLRPETETDEDGKATRVNGKLVLELQKSNLGHADQQIPLRWDDDAHMFVADAAPTRFDASLVETEERSGVLSSIREVILSGDFVPAAAQGPRTAYHVLSACKSFPHTLKNRGGKRRFWRHIETLRRNSAITDASIKRAGRHETATIALGAAPTLESANVPIPL
jgi:RecA-family ATPase